MDSCDELRTRSCRKRRLNVRPSNSEKWTVPLQPKYPGKRSRCFVLSESELADFLSLLTTDPVIAAFHLQDACCRSSDKYLIAMALVYFKKSGLARESYNRYNFFAALYLALDMEDESDDDKWEILPWALGRHWKTNFADFIKTKNKMWQNMDFSAAVSKRCCEQVFAMPGARNHPAFNRTRQANHGYVCNRRFDLPEKKSGLHSPQGPLWKNYTRSKHGPEKWPQVLGRVQWRCCSVCKASPLDVWKQSNNWEMFHLAKTVMFQYEEISQKNVILEMGLDLTSDEEEDYNEINNNIVKINLEINNAKRHNKIDSTSQPQTSVDSSIKSPRPKCSQEKHFASDSGKSSGDDDLFGTSGGNSHNLVNPVFDLAQLHELKKNKNLSNEVFMQLMLST